MRSSFTLDVLVGGHLVPLVRGREARGLYGIVAGHVNSRRSALFLSSDRSRHPPRPCRKALRFGFGAP